MKKVLNYLPIVAFAIFQIILHYLYYFKGVEPNNFHVMISIMLWISFLVKE